MAYLLDINVLLALADAKHMSILDIVDPVATIMQSQITDIYLLGLAAARGERFATLDGRINATAVRGGREALFVIRV